MDKLTTKVDELRESVISAKKRVKSTSMQKADTTLREYVAENKVKVPSHNFKVKRTLKGHVAKIHDISFCQNEPTLFVTASQDGKLIVWDGPTSHKVYVVPLKSPWVLCCAFAPGGNRVASGGLNNAVSVYNLNPEEPVPEDCRELLGHNGGISKLHFHSDEQLLSVSGDKTVMLWDVETGKAETTFYAHDKDVSCVDSVRDDNIFITGGLDQTCYLWDIRDNKPQMSFTGHDSDVNCVKFFPSNTAFASGSDDGTVRLYDLRGDRELMTFLQPADENDYTFGISSLDFSVSGNYMFTALSTNICYAWSTLSGEVISNLPHSQRVSCVRVAPDGSAIATGCWDSYIRLFV